MLELYKLLKQNCMGTVTSLWVISHTLPLVLLLPITNLNLISSQKFIVNSKYTGQRYHKLNKSGINPSWTDIYYQGDVTKWTQLAYSLKARYYLHVKIPLAKSNALKESIVLLMTLKQSLVVLQPDKTLTLL
jgi:hypothetical protein